jgi:HD-like signal output (HDOD) protein
VASGIGSRRLSATTQATSNSAHSSVNRAFPCSGTGDALSRAWAFPEEQSRTKQNKAEQESGKVSNEGASLTTTLLISPRSSRTYR